VTGLILGALGVVATVVAVRTGVRIDALPALPLAAFMGGVTVLFGAHGLLWPRLMNTERGMRTASVAVYQ
jgi:hypothetical protein